MQRLKLTARRFFSHAGSMVGWTDLSALHALERFYRDCGMRFNVDRALCANCPLMPHGSGVSFDLGGQLSWKQRQKLRIAAVESGLFFRVMTEQLCPDHVHVDCLQNSTLRYGDSGVFVFALQSALQKCAFYSGVCSGVFDEMTLRAVLRAQLQLGLPRTGIADMVLQQRLLLALTTDKMKRR